LQLRWGYLNMLIFRSSFPVYSALVTSVTSSLPAAWCSPVLWGLAQPVQVHCRGTLGRARKMLILWQWRSELNFLTMSWRIWCLLQHENTSMLVLRSKTQTWNSPGKCQIVILTLPYLWGGWLRENPTIGVHSSVLCLCFSKTEEYQVVPQLWISLLTWVSVPRLE